MIHNEQQTVVVKSGISLEEFRYKSIKMTKVK